MPTSERMLRVNELLRRELAVLCEREISPGFDGLVTITGVETSPDLRQATVFVSILGDEQHHQLALQLLTRKRKLLQREVARHVTLKYTPVLRFKIDRTAETADRVLAILDDLHLPDEDTSQEQ